MRYGVACGSHCIVWQIVASCGMGEGGGLRVAVKKGVKDRVGEDGVLVVVLSSSYLYRICKPDDGSREPKHVAPCTPLFLISNSNLYFIVCY